MVFAICSYGGIWRRLYTVLLLSSQKPLDQLYFHPTIPDIKKDLMHETSAWAWCTGKTQRERVEREVGGGIGMGNTCVSMADSCQCMAKTTTIL